MRIIIAAIALVVSLFASGPASAQIIYQPPVSGQLVPVTGPNCPQVSSLATAPAVHIYSVCTYPRLGSGDGRANVTVPGGIALRWRYFIDVQTWWWPFTVYKQEVTAIAYSGQSVLTDWFEVYYYPSYAVPGLPIYPPIPIYPPPVTAPPPYTPPMPGLPSPGTPAPPRTETGVGNFSLAFAQGWVVVGWRLQFVSGRTVYTCYILSAPEPGWVTDGVISPNSGDLARAPTPCP